MKVACLQFAPKLGKVQENIQRAERILEDADLGGVDLLVLPELAFTGYNFPSLSAITPFLEPTTSGPTTQWALKTASRLSCTVSVGYPERSTTTGTAAHPSPNYNSLVTVSPTGQVLANYRKSHLYYTDETWASEGNNGFHFGDLGGRVGKVVMGICMDINPYKFFAPWSDFEFARRVLTEDVPTVVLSMAWLAHPAGTEPPEEWTEEQAREPDMPTLAYWMARFEPILEETRRKREKEVVIVMGNRCGREPGACYAGTSAVFRVKAGQMEMWDILGRGEERCLIVDTDKPPKFALRRQIMDEDEDEID